MNIEHGTLNGPEGATLNIEELLARDEALLRQCRSCRYLLSIQEISYLQVRVDDDVECSKVEQGDRAFIIYRDDGRCTRHAPRLVLVRGGAG